MDVVMKYIPSTCCLGPRSLSRWWTSLRLSPPKIRGRWPLPLPPGQSKYFRTFFSEFDLRFGCTWSCDCRPYLKASTRVSTVNGVCFLHFNCLFQSNNFMLSIVIVDTHRQSRHLRDDKNWDPNDNISHF